MSDTVENKVVEMLDALQNGAVEVGNQIVKYSPDIANTALTVVRIDGVQTLVVSLVAFIIASTVLFFVGRQFFREWRGHKLYYDTPSPRDDEYRCFRDNEGLQVFYGIVGTLAGVRTVGAFCDLVNVWHWVAVFEPKLYLAKQIIDTVVHPGK